MALDEKNFNKYFKLPTLFLVQFEKEDGKQTAQWVKAVNGASLWAKIQVLEVENKYSYLCVVAQMPITTPELMAEMLCATPFDFDGETTLPFEYMYKIAACGGLEVTE